MCLWVLSYPLSNLGQQSLVGDQVKNTGKLSTGLRIPAILNSHLASNKSKIGDPVQLEVVVDIHDKSGAVVIPRHSKLTGRVTGVSRYEKKQQPAMLSFVIDRAEWKNHTAVLDAPVFGTDVFATDSKNGEMVEGIRVATLRHSDSLNLVNMTMMYDFRIPGNVPQALHDIVMHDVVMKLELLPDPVIRTAFVKEDGDLELNSEFMVVLLNGMQVVD